jgi:plasmid stabilization system protein ParE
VNYSVRLREEAESDLAEAAAWYERQRVGLGHEFLDEVMNILESTGVRPFSFPEVHRGIHRAIIGRFPFSVYYRVTGTQVVVLAIMHSTRHPARWQNRS